MNVLELFSGTGSVGKCAKELGYDVLSIDIDGRADITCDIMDFDYKSYDKDHFDIVWASPPCASFSVLQYGWIGRNRNGKIFTRQDIETNMTTIGDPLVKRTLEIIDYFKPELWFMENPNTGNLKSREYMKDLPYYIVDYCMYSDWGYRKRTRIWTNKKDWKPLTCDGKGTCGNMIGSLHKTNLGNTERLLKAEKRLKHKEDVSGLKKRTKLDDRYRIPENLIFSLFVD
jgi:site-specific DNA-cytosine methylase|tara:strand:- start:38 stop:724 length:687 start_codon:yes stop_codon:yes gene_type:complete